MEDINQNEWSIVVDEPPYAPLILERTYDQPNTLTISSSEGEFVKINLITGEHLFGPGVPKLDVLAKTFWDVIATFAPEYGKQPKKLQPSNNHEDFDQALKILDQ